MNYIVSKRIFCQIKSFFHKFLENQLPIFKVSILKIELKSFRMISLFGHFNSMIKCLKYQSMNLFIRRIIHWNWDRHILHIRWYIIVVITRIIIFSIFWLTTLTLYKRFRTEIIKWIKWIFIFFRYFSRWRRRKFITDVFLLFIFISKNLSL